jgi:hypothetical protein
MQRYNGRSVPRVAAARVLPDETAPESDADSGRLTAGPALILGCLDGCGLFKPLGEGELADSSGVLAEQLAEV